MPFFLAILLGIAQSHDAQAMTVRYDVRVKYDYVTEIMRCTEITDICPGELLYEYVEAPGYSGIYDGRGRPLSVGARIESYFIVNVEKHHKGNWDFYDPINYYYEIRCGPKLGYCFDGESLRIKEFNPITGDISLDAVRGDSGFYLEIFDRKGEWFFTGGYVFDGYYEWRGIIRVLSITGLPESNLGGGISAVPLPSALSMGALSMLLLFRTSRKPRRVAVG